MRQGEPHQAVAGLQQRVVDGRVGRRAGVRLDVRVLGAEQRLRAVDRELLDHVDVLAAAVVALAGIALGVLVREHAALALEHGLRHEVLRGDHLQRALLALELVADGLGDLGVDLGERALEVVGLQGGHAVTVANESRPSARLASSAACVRELTPSLRRHVADGSVRRALVDAQRGGDLLVRRGPARRGRGSRDRRRQRVRGARRLGSCPGRPQPGARGVERERRGPRQDDPDRPVVAGALVGGQRGVSRVSHHVASSAKDPAAKGSASTRNASRVRRAGGSAISGSSASPWTCAFASGRTDEHRRLVPRRHSRRMSWTETARGDVRQGGPRATVTGDVRGASYVRQRLVDVRRPRRSRTAERDRSPRPAIGARAPGPRSRSAARRPVRATSHGSRDYAAGRSAPYSGVDDDSLPADGAGAIHGGGLRVHPRRATRTTPCVSRPNPRDG